MKLYLDLETYNDVDIKVGTYRYAETVEITLFAYAIDEAPAKVWDLTDGSPRPNELTLALENCDIVLAHNAQFDRTMLRQHGMAPALSRWECTMARALAHGLPGGLDKLSDILGLSAEKAKVKDGKALVLFFCKPRPKNSKLRRANRFTHPEEWARFVDYARLDVEALREMDRKLPTWNYKGDELALWRLDQKINDRGISIDLELAHAAVRVRDDEKKRLGDQVEDLTMGFVTSATQRQNAVNWLREFHGVEVDNLTGSYLESLLGEGNLPEAAIELIEIRLEASLTTPKKYDVLLKGTNTDGRIRGLLQFCGANRTGRWAGRLFQPQNLMRPARFVKKEIDNCIAAIKAGCMELIYDKPMSVLGSCIRGAMIAAPGKELFVTDLSNIEGRMLAWLAGEDWKVEAFRQFDKGIGFDLYLLSYARAFGTPVEEVDDDMRQIGKVMELALGYQGGPGAFNAMAAVYGVELPLDKVIELVKAWRAANPEIKSFWYELDKIVKEAIRTPGKVFKCRRIQVARQGPWLMLVLPSGRRLCYAYPELDDDNTISYMGINQYTRQWERLTTYGGKLVENITQAAARDALAHNMPEIEAQGYEILLTVHDEVITEAEFNQGHSHTHLSRLLSTNPPWAPGLPLASKGWQGPRYKKD